MSSTKVVIKCSDMPEKIQLEAISQGIQAFFRNPPTNPENPSDSYMKIAEEIKREFDHKYKKTWHCIVGKNFGSFVTHESKTFIFFEIAGVSILLFKSAKVES
jgi:dynein light chain LC8-type